MDSFTVIILILFICNLAALIWLLVAFRRSRGQINTDKIEATVQLMKAELVARQAESLVALRESIDGANRTLHERLSEGTSTLDRRMEIFSEIENKLGQLATQAKNIETIGSNISSLSELLKAPKLRGNLGEFLLENLLSEILPPAMYETQHRFSTGQRVDAVVKLAGKLLPIDAKFPLEAYERLLKQPDDRAANRDFAASLAKHVDDISSKYIKPHEETTDFALMYLPAEAVYYQLISQPDYASLRYALSKHVIPSSPGHLYGFLASVAAVYAESHLMQSGLVEGSRKLLAGLQDMTTMLSRLEQYHDRMNGSLRSLSASFDKARQETASLAGRLEKLREPSAGAEKIVVETASDE